MTVVIPASDHPLRVHSNIYKDTLTPSIKKTQFTHVAIRQQIEAFLEAGGCIQEIPSEEIPPRLESAWPTVRSLE